VAKEELEEGDYRNIQLWSVALEVLLKERDQLMMHLGMNK
jgi:hypothetical protein